MILMLVPATGLLLWTLTPEPAQSVLFLPVWIASSCLIFSASLESARLRRRVWLDQYLLVGSPWHRLLRGGLPMIIWHLLIACLLALFMLARLLHLNGWLSLLLVVQIPLIWSLQRWLDARLQAHVRDAVRPAVCRRLLVPLIMLPLLTCYLAVSLWLSQPDMVSVSWAEAISRHLPEAHSAIGFLALCERTYLLLDLTLQWAMQNALGSRDETGALAILAWSLLLVGGAAFTLAWVRMLVGVGALCRREEGI